MAPSSVQIIAAVALIGCLFHGACAVDRVYYIAAVEENWDYAPSGMNNITGAAFQPSTAETEKMVRSGTRIGRVYKKALFREYTDETFTERSARPEWLGMLGPIIKAEVGDRVIVHFRNMASRPYSINPGGLGYTKSAEGALYDDATSGNQKSDDAVQPNTTFIYRWTTGKAGPKQGQAENCIGWQYTSHRFTTQDQNAGLVGMTIICRKGFLASTNNDIVLLYGHVDENQSWYIEENIDTFASGVTPTMRASEEFIGSNIMNTVNGYSYGNLPGLQVCQGEQIRWFVFNFGGETNIHSVFFNGNPLELDGKRADTIPLIPGPVSVVTMETMNPGTWLVSSLSTTDALSGGSALYTVRSDCGTAGASNGATANGNLVEHFIAIQEVNWDYAPLVSKSPTGSGPTYLKAAYFGYTDATFSQYIRRTQDEAYLGLIGPVIRAEVGDNIRVTLMNGASRPYNIHPNNVMYTKANEGYPYVDGIPANQASGDSVAPQATYTYNWTVPPSYGPTASDPDCITGIYYSTVGGDRDLHSGLVGPLIVCKPGKLSSNGTQEGIDQEVITVILSMNEERSWYWNTNRNVRYNSDFPVDEIRTINGYVSDNLPLLGLCSGDRVRWHAPCIGNEETYMGLHIPYQTFEYHGRRANTIPVLPGQTEEVDFTVGSPGTWIINGNVYNYDLEVNYTVSECYKTIPDSQRVRKKERTFFLAAEEVIWDFAPTEYDYITGQNLSNPNSEGYYFVEEGPTYIGREYKKVRFVEYTDDTFTTPKNRTYWEQHLGILGPFIRAEVDETVKIVFKNNATRQFSVNAHNLPGQATEYMGQTFNTPIPVQPGETAIYRWTMLEKAGPTDSQSNCVVWPYYSSIVTKKDTNSGLIAPLVVCRNGVLNDQGQRTDVDHDFALLYTIFDENDNWYLDDNIRMFTNQPNQVDKEAVDFEHSNDAFTINGYIFGYPLNISMAVGDNIAFYIIVVGGGADVHSINFHGHTVTQKTRVTKNLDSVPTLPGDFLTVEMEATKQGTWLLHDAVNKHSDFGTETRYTVYAKKSDIPCGPECKSGRPPAGAAGRLESTIISLVVAFIMGAIVSFR
ncbi:hephaestin-like protein [Lytechinus variegatus]|uniref:hephaestin-like protein n=1 Tax=Lytechinus variegatus TaxID=7654 RepID=UPI001BB2BFDC|nr:hephaestin-like protein [Lytechinus variegatus]XP_041484094.1 hephaestin-like protein [Lytechinus variegatus]